MSAKSAAEPVATTRVRSLAERPAKRDGYVLYWMQQSQRAVDNDALTYAIGRANEAKLPLVVGFGLTDGYPEANVRHYRFMLEGLAEVQASLEQQGIAFVARRGSPEDVAIALAADAALVVCDRGHLRHQKRWRRTVADAVACEVVEVDADVVVPVDLASDHAEFAARTLRPKVNARLLAMLHAPASLRLLRPSLKLDMRSEIDFSDVNALLASLTVARDVPAVNHLFVGGTAAALAHLRRFVAHDLRGYADRRPQPARAAVSHLSKHLHFGQVSPVTVARAVRAHRGDPPDVESFIEELVVRRELAHNFTAYREDYDRYDAIPSWARATLEAHAKDARPHVYSLRELEAARTHDRYWNAAMREMKYTGYMHNALRMYWGKKILEWTPRPDDAYATALALNNKYFLDGRDPNSYANVSWVFGLHDRPWPERAVFGKVRTMVASGLERKSDIGAYVDDVDRKVAQAEAAGVTF